MLKLVVSDDRLSINDGDIILSRWTTESHFGKVFVRDAFGFIIEESKMPIETQEGERTDAADVITDIGANWKGIDLSYYYQWIMTGKPNEIEALDVEGYGYKNYGSGTLEIPIGDVSGVNLLTDTYFQLGEGYLYDVTVLDNIGTSIIEVVDGLIKCTTAGNLFYFKLSNGEEFWCQENNGIEIYGVNGIVESSFLSPTRAWDNTLIFNNELTL